MNNENMNLKKDIEDLERKVEQGGNINEKLSRAILAAEEAADKMKKLAKAESEMMIEDAKRNANVENAKISAKKCGNLIIYRHSSFKAKRPWFTAAKYSRRISGFSSLLL